MVRKTVNKRDAVKAQKKVARRAEKNAKQAKKETFLERLGIKKSTLFIAIAIIVALATFGVYSIISTGKETRNRMEFMDRFNFEMQQRMAQFSKEEEGVLDIPNQEPGEDDFYAAELIDDDDSPLVEEIYVNQEEYFFVSCLSLPR